MLRRAVVDVSSVEPHDSSTPNQYATQDVNYPAASDYDTPETLILDVNGKMPIHEGGMGVDLADLVHGREDGPMSQDFDRVDVYSTDDLAEGGGHHLHLGIHCDAADNVYRRRWSNGDLRVVQSIQGFEPLWHEGVVVPRGIQFYLGVPTRTPDGASLQPKEYVELVAEPDHVGLFPKPLYIHVNEFERYFVDVNDTQGGGRTDQPPSRTDPKQDQRRQVLLDDDEPETDPGDTLPGRKSRKLSIRRPPVGRQHSSDRRHDQRSLAKPARARTRVCLSDGPFLTVIAERLEPDEPYVNVIAKCAFVPAQHFGMVHIPEGAVFRVENIIAARRLSPAIVLLTAPGIEPIHVTADECEDHFLLTAANVNPFLNAGDDVVADVTFSPSLQGSTVVVQGEIYRIRNIERGMMKGETVKVVLTPEVVRDATGIHTTLDEFERFFSPLQGVEPGRDDASHGEGERTPVGPLVDSNERRDGTLLLHDRIGTRDNCFNASYTLGDEGTLVHQPIPKAAADVDRQPQRSHVPWVCVDLDGTILEKVRGEPGTQPPLGKPLPGAVEALRELGSLGWRISVWTARFMDAEGDEVRDWAHAIAEHLTRVGIPFTDIWVGPKPRADYFVDDRAVAFDGNWPRVLEQVTKAASRRAFGGALDYDDDVDEARLSDSGQGLGVERPPELEHALYGSTQW